MKKLAEKLSKLSALNITENELKNFIEDFNDIIPLIDEISEFSEKSATILHAEKFENLRSDVVKTSLTEINTKTVPRVIS